MTAHKKSLKAAGFSLIEIMIVMTIMAGMAVVSSRSIRTAVMNKKKIDARLKTETVVFDALRLMATDVEKAFHHQNVLYELERQALQKRDQTNKNINNGNNNAPQAPPLPPPARLTQFIGKENSMHFTTLNNQRITANAPESDQIEVGYYLNTCKSRVKKDKTSQCLWRRTSTIIDNDVTRDGQATRLVENVSLFKLEYMSEDQNLKDWKTTWLTDQNGDATTQNLFPYLVRITLETYDKDNPDIGKFKQTIVASVRFTNNIDPAKRFQPQTAQQNNNNGGGAPNNNGGAGGNTGGGFGNNTGGTTGGGTGGVNGGALGGGAGGVN